MHTHGQGRPGQAKEWILTNMLQPNLYSTKSVNLMLCLLCHSFDLCLLWTVTFVQLHFIRWYTLNLVQNWILKSIAYINSNDNLLSFLFFNIFVSFSFFGLFSLFLLRTTLVQKFAFYEKSQWNLWLFVRRLDTLEFRRTRQLDRMNSANLICFWCHHFPSTPFIWIDFLNGHFSGDFNFELTV